ncbi:hypothetical protein BXZ70DRAFT_781410 [Cristinia sonorae]|uniref:F-box domain-containing protein n=1 Tax=Cristinia sonorae TaxID=1940300 RepID=A0A8K0XRG9_9AGAR|nr:hypothetical protein BXZ70DRAFT_781410 [Cristinia sonorae]
MSFSVFPQEITDYVLDFLHDNPKALRACAKTCRSWLPTSYLHLFANITFQSPASCSAFGTLLQDAPYLGQLVHDITFPMLFDTKHHDQQLGSAVVDVPIPTTAYAALSALKRLNLMMWNFDIYRYEGFASLHSVTHLNLHFCRFPSFHSFAVFIMSFPNLEDLNIRDVTWEIDSEPAMPLPSLDPSISRLRKLATGIVTSLPQFVAWLRASGLQCQISCVSVRCSSEDEATALRVLSSSIGDALQNLEVDWLLRKPISSPENYDVNARQSIKSLTLRFPIYNYQPLSWPTALLSSVVTSSELELLNLEIRLLGDLDCVEWRALRRILNSSSARSLKQVGMKVLVWPTARLPCQDIESFIRNYLPEISARGLLRFE